METKTPQAAESRNAEEPKQDPQGEEKVTELSRQEEDQEQFRLLVEDLFDSYDPDSALEEADVTMIARALWMKRAHSELNSDTRLLDQEINTALGRLYKSKVIRKNMGLSKRPFETLSARHNNSRRGLIRRPVMTKMQARPRRPAILKPLVPVAAAIDPDPQRTRGNALIRKKWSDGRGHGLSPEEAGELHAIKGWRVPDEHDARRRSNLEGKEARTADEETEFARLRALCPVPLDYDPRTEEQQESWAQSCRAVAEAAKGR